MALSDNIKKFREEKNLTQQQLADKLYVSRQTVCRWETGSRCPDLLTVKKLALELGVSTVSYTHLDVYKRQAYACTDDGCYEIYYRSRGDGNIFYYDYATEQLVYFCLLYTSRCV